jgi:DNA polymerase-3 subunit delta
MKIAPAEAERFVREPGPELVVALVYGPDGGLVRERARKIALTVVEDLADPFRATEIAAAALRDDPAKLSDEACAMSLMGGRRVVRLRDAGDAAATAVEDVLASASAEDVMVVVEAGDLGPRSKLRKLAEGAGNAAALACYADDARSLGAVIRETLGEAGLSATPDAVAYLSDHLGSDRMLSRMELEKLATYVFGASEVTLEDAEAVVGDGAATTLDDISFATAAGDTRTLDRALQLAFDEGTNAIGVVRAAQRHFQRLHRAAGEVAAGRAPDQAMKALRPPVFFKRAAAFRDQLAMWNAARLAGALDALTEAEIACKSTGIPSEAACRRALLAIAARAAQLRGNRS